MKVLHCADIHLGRKRLDGRLPNSDFVDAFNAVVNRALKWRADVLIIAGDLFDSPQIPPPILRQAVTALRPLQEHGIPVIAVEGNHDRIGYSGSHNPMPSWIRFLSDEGLLILLSTPFTQDGPEISAFDPEKGGAYVEIGGVRFVGAGYLGAGTGRKVGAIVSAIPADGMPSVMLLHAGPEYFVGEGGGFSAETLDLLRERITYLALGHIHKPMIHRDEHGHIWAVNPGSPENCRLQEANFDTPRGYAEVEIESNALPGMALMRAEIFDTPRRPVTSVEVDVTPFGNKLKGGAQAIADAASKAVKGKKFARETILRVFLKGSLNIGRIAVEPSVMAQELEKKINVAGVDVDVSGIQLYTGRQVEKSARPDLPTAEIERLALEDLLRQRPIDGLENKIEDTAKLFIQLKDFVAQRADDEAILEALTLSSLPNLVAEEDRKVGL